MTQPCLPEVFGPRVPRQHKRQRQTAREVYRVQREQDKAKRAVGKEDRQAQVLRCLAAHWNLNQFSPTAKELFVWMLERGERLEDMNDVRPKIFYLVEKGLVESAGTRKCRITNKNVHTWRVREIGSLEQR